MFKKFFLKNHFNNFFSNPRIFVFINQVKDFIKSNLIIANVVNNIFIIKRFYIINIKKDINNINKRDILEAIFQNSPHSNSGFIVKEKIKVFVNKFFD